jgi:hypothetical protein
VHEVWIWACELLQSAATRHAHPSTPAVRGRVVEMYELLLCAGMVAALLCDAALQSLPGNWRWMVGAPVLPALVLSCEGLPGLRVCPVSCRAAGWLEGYVVAGWVGCAEAVAC